MTEVRRLVESPTHWVERYPGETTTGQHWAALLMPKSIQSPNSKSITHRSGRLLGLTLYLDDAGKRDIAFVLYSELAKQLEARR